MNSLTVRDGASKYDTSFKQTCGLKYCRWLTSLSILVSYKYSLMLAFLLIFEEHLVRRQSTGTL